MNRDRVPCAPCHGFGVIDIYDYLHWPITSPEPDRIVIQCEACDGSGFVKVPAGRAEPVAAPSRVDAAVRVPRGSSF